MPASPDLNRTAAQTGHDGAQRGHDEAPARLRLADLHPELRRAYRWTTQAFVTRDWQRRTLRAAMRLMPPARLPKGMTRERIRFDQPGTGVRVFTPAGGGNGSALLWIHGGGLVIGAAVQDDAMCARFAAELDTVVVSVEYRLAPEHPFPTPLEDCAAAWHWLVDASASLDLDPHRLAIGGQSAGGGLAAALAQRLHDEGGTQPVAQWLFCPMLDDRPAARTELDDIGHYLWGNRANRAAWGAYLGVDPGRHSELTVMPEYAVPARRAALEGLAPAWIGVGGVDLFAAECCEYAGDLRAAGVVCEFDLVEGAPHAVERFGSTTALGRAYLGRALDWLRPRLAVPAA